jgi:hypothetical protein
MIAAGVIMLGFVLISTLVLQDISQYTKRGGNGASLSKKASVTLKQSAADCFNTPAGQPASKVVVTRVEYGFLHASLLQRLLYRE